MLINYTTEQNTIKQSPASRAPLVLGINYTLLAIATLMVGCRILVKAKLGKLGVEDALILISLSIIIGLMVTTQLMIKYGFGLHITDIHLDWWPTYSKFSYAQIALGCVPYPLTKVSMLIFYLRLAPQPTFRKICFATITYIVISATILILLALFACTPVRGGWDHSLSLGAKCLDITGYIYFYTGTNILTDILLMVLPIPILMRLQLRSRTKYGLVAMFAIGILITAISAYSVYTMYRAYNGVDAIWDGAKSWLMALVEFNSGIIVACMPSMLLFGKWVSGDISGGKSAGSSSGRTAAMNATIGSGGRRNVLTMDTGTRNSIRLGSQEYIMQESDGIVKSTEVMVMEMTVLPGGERSQSMC